MFSGDAEATLDLDRVDTIGKCLPKAWAACLALADYVLAKTERDFGGGMVHYLRNTPSDLRTFSDGNHAPVETSITMKQHSDERIFPAPEWLATRGHREMQAHFKLGKVAHCDPRMYYFDDTSDSGKVVIGYIGKHLTNSHT